MPTYIRINTKGIDNLVRRLGSQQLAQRAQIAMTREVDKRIGRYMAFRTGVMSGKAKRMISPSQILVDTPYARYQYYGKVMVNSNTGKGPRLIPGVGFRWPKGAILKVTDRPLQYDTSKNAKAGPYWDKALMDNESTEIFESVANEIIRAARGE